MRVSSNGLWLILVAILYGGLSEQKPIGARLAVQPKGRQIPTLSRVRRHLYANSATYIRYGQIAGSAASLSCIVYNAADGENATGKKVCIGVTGITTAVTLIEKLTTPGQQVNAILPQHNNMAVNWRTESRLATNIIRMGGIGQKTATNLGSDNTTSGNRTSNEPVWWNVLEALEGAYQASPQVDTRRGTGVIHLGGGLNDVQYDDNVQKHTVNAIGITPPTNYDNFERWLYDMGDGRPYDNGLSEWVADITGFMSDNNGGYSCICMESNGVVAGLMEESYTSSGYYHGYGPNQCNYNLNSEGHLDVNAGCAKAYIE